ncbi:hypothetical protein B0H21DRAFT_676762, partial [Amylocystis lapponica]
PHIVHVLTIQKHDQPDAFRQELRVSPWTFDRILAEISGDPIFSNNSPNAQFSVEHQLAVTLYHFGHFGNTAGQQKITNWSGNGIGTIPLITKRVMAALLRRQFLDMSIQMPTADEKEDAKAWVESRSCRAWHDGWCLVDGTLVPLAECPYWYGESYFDRKCNYSLNIQ